MKLLIIVEHHGVLLLSPWSPCVILSALHRHILSSHMGEFSKGKAQQHLQHQHMRLAEGGAWLGDWALGAWRGLSERCRCS